MAGGLSLLWVDSLMRTFLQKAQCGHLCDFGNLFQLIWTVKMVKFNAVRMVFFLFGALFAEE